MGDRIHLQRGEGSRFTACGRYQMLRDLNIDNVDCKQCQSIYWMGEGARPADVVAFPAKYLPTITEALNRWQRLFDESDGGFEIIQEALDNLPRPTVQSDQNKTEVAHNG